MLDYFNKDQKNFQVSRYNHLTFCLFDEQKIPTFSFLFNNTTEFEKRELLIYLIKQDDIENICECLSQHFLKFTGIVKSLNVITATNEFPIYENSWHTFSSGQFTESILNILTIGTVFQLNRQEIKFQFLELLKMTK